MKGIYKIACTQENIVYIGSSVNIEVRWKKHKSDLNRGLHHSYKLQDSWDAYGDESFIFSVLEETNNLSKEQEYLNHYIGNCYNLALDVINPMHNPEIAKKQAINTTANGNRSNQILTVTEVLEIQKLLNSGCSTTEVASMFMVSTKSIADIKSGKRWFNFTNIERNNIKNKLSEEDVIQIKTYLRDTTLTLSNIAKIYDVSTSLISGIKSGYRWNRIKISGFTEGTSRKSTDCLAEILVLKENKLSHREIAEILGFNNANAISYALKTNKLTELCSA